MLLSTLWHAAFAAVALSPWSAMAKDDNKDEKDNPDGQSTFISPNDKLGFALSVPDHGNTDIYFSIRVHTKYAWGAVGLGSEDMRGALILMIYQNHAGKNITFSPRIAWGNYEPHYYPELKYEVLDGTGIVDDYMVFNARCIEHCRSWDSGTNQGTDGKGGSIDVNDPDQRGIWALGPSESFRSNKHDAPIRFHQEFGAFKLDVKRSRGQDKPPVLTDNTKSEGTEPIFHKTGKSDWRSALHATFMIFFIMAMMPLGVIFLRVGKWARWHGVNQGVALLGVLGGFALGIVTSFRYQRSRSFKSYHQIIGYIVIAFLLAQFCIGFWHHLEFRKSQKSTNYGFVHIWLGRVTIFLGSMNAFIGFIFAVNRKYGAVLAALLIFLGFAVFAVSVGRQRFLKKKRGYAGTGPLAGPPQSYQPEPWRDNSAQAGYSAEPPPGYEAPSQQLGLQPVSPWRRDGKDDEDDPALGGTAQRPREFA